MFKDYYRRRFADLTGVPLTEADGLGDEAVVRALAQHGLEVPRALADYYSVAGRHPINRQHNRLYPIAELEWRDDRLVFLEENQRVAFWRLPRTEVGRADPVVWQAPNAGPLEWVPEGYRLSQFLMAMWRWQLDGVEEDAAPGTSS